MPKNFSQKGFTKNFLDLMKQTETNKECCLNFLNEVYTAPSSFIQFTGNGNKNNPLVANLVNESVLGELYNKSSWVDLSDFVITGPTTSVVANKIQISNTEDSLNFNNAIALPGFTALEYWKMEMSFTIDSVPSSTTFGLGLGVNAWIALPDGTFLVNSGASSNFGVVDLSTDINAGKVTYFNVSPSEINARSTTAVPFNQGDQIVLIVERNFTFITISTYNATQKSALVQTTYDFPSPITNANSILASNGRFSIFSLGGTYTVNSLQLSSSQVVRPDILVIGDSKTVGYQESTITNRLASILRKSFITSSANAGVGDTTAEVRSRLPEILAINPKQILLSIGCNDVRNGRTYLDANYKYIVSTLQAAGIPVYHLCYYESDIDLSGLNEFINQNYGSNVIDTYTITQLSGALYADGIHLTDVGNLLIYNEVINSGKLTTGLIAQETNLGTPNAIPYYNAVGLINATSALSFLNSTLFVNGAASFSQPVSGVPAVLPNEFATLSQVSGGGGGNPGGSDNSIQYAEGGAFAGDSNFTWEPVSQTFTVLGANGPALVVAPSTGNVLIGSQTDNGSLLQVAGTVAINPFAGSGACLQLGSSSFTNPFIEIEGASSQAPGFQAWIMQLDGSGNFVFNEGISGAQVARFSVYAGVPQFTSFGALYPGQYSTTDKLALVPTVGAVVFDITLNKLCIYNGTAWETVTSA
jgi:hypothetical protein